MRSLSNSQVPNLTDIDLLVFDFDGVLTDNSVYVSTDGLESVRCSRADGLAFDVLRKLEKLCYILSTEKNSVVTKRAEKLKLPVIHGVSDKVEILNNLVKQNQTNFQRVVYLGNDLNDYCAMKKCAYSACPADSHPRIREIAKFVLNTNGGEGVVRELVEHVFELDVLNILFNGD